MDDFITCDGCHKTIDDWFPQDHYENCSLYKEKQKRLAQEAEQERQFIETKKRLADTCPKCKTKFNGVYDEVFLGQVLHRCWKCNIQCFPGRWYCLQGTSDAICWKPLREDLTCPTHSGGKNSGTSKYSGKKDSGTTDKDGDVEFWLGVLKEANDPEADKHAPMFVQNRIQKVDVGNYQYQWEDFKRANINLLLGVYKAVCRICSQKKRR